MPASFSKSNATDNTIDVSGAESRAQRGGANSNQATDNAVVVDYGKNNKLGPDLSGVKGDVTYTVTNTSGVTEAGIASLVDQFSTSSKDTVEKVLGTVGALAENKQTDGDASRNKIVLYAVLAVVALLGVFVWKGK